MSWKADSEGPAGKEEVAYRVRLAMTHRESQLSEESAVKADGEQSSEYYEDDSRLSRIRRWTSELWSTTTRAG